MTEGDRGDETQQEQAEEISWHPEETESQRERGERRRGDTKKPKTVRNNIKVSEKEDEGGAEATTPSIGRANVSLTRSFLKIINSERSH